MQALLSSSSSSSGCSERCTASAWLALQQLQRYLSQNGNDARYGGA